MAPPPSPSFLLDWRGAEGEGVGMISGSEGSARFALLDGLRLPSSRLRPSPKPIATEGTPIARMREQTIAARAEKRKDFMLLLTPGGRRSCAAEWFRPEPRRVPYEKPLSGATKPASYRSPGCLVGF